MKCEDCGFEHEDGPACPRCGYDPKVDLVACVKAENPKVSNPLETELAAFCQKVEAEGLDKAKIQEQWKILDNKAREGNLDARHLFGRAALMRQDHSTALRILGRLADAGHALAQLDLAKMHEEGLGTEASPFDAIKLYRLAAAQGNPIALFKLAEQHGGSGVLRPDPALANALMQELVTAHPGMFQRKPNCAGGSCGCGNGLSNREFAAQTASQMSKMIRYLVIAGIVALVAYMIWTEFHP